jgi:hypothetical protein
MAKNRRYIPTSWLEARAETFFLDDPQYEMFRACSKSPTWAMMRAVYGAGFHDGQEHPEINVEEMEKGWSYEA